MANVNICDRCSKKFEDDKSCWGPILEPCLLKYPKYPADWIRRKPDRKSDEFELMFKSYCPKCGRTGSVDAYGWFKSRKIIRNGFEDTIESEHSEEAKRELDQKTRTLPLFEVDHPFETFVDI